LIVRSLCHQDGTRSAGIIGAMTNNNVGIAGINWKPKIVACRFLDINLEGTMSGLVECIDYTIAIKCPVANYSNTMEFYGGTTFSSAMDQSLDAAGAVGQLVVMAVGSDGRDVGELNMYPAAYNKPNQISVAALDSTGDKLVHFSDYSPELVHIAAPGADIWSTFSNVHHTERLYLNFAGSAVATPQVSGAASLMLSFKPSLTYADVKNVLQTTAAEFTDWESGVKWGKLDLGAAMELLASATTTTTTPTTTTAETTTSAEYEDSTTAATAVHTVTPVANYIMASTDLTCEVGCEQHNMYCDNELTKLSGIDLEGCYNGLVSSGYGSDTPLAEGGINNSLLAPGGCYVEMYSVVHLNSNLFGFELGCHGNVVHNTAAQRVCVCI